MQVDWYLGDTTDSLGFLQDGLVDVAITYNDAAEKQSLQMGYAKRRVYAFKDHFFLVGPSADPAQLDDAVDVLDAFNKIVTCGNRDVTTPPTDRPPTRFLSRFDKSATNIKESQLFITIGQVPWALAYSKWYHQYPRFPLEALQAAAALNEYTLTDKGIWLSSPPEVTSALRIYRRGDDYNKDPDNWLLNPGRALLGAKAVEKDLANSFLDWLIDDNGGPEVVLNFKKGDPQETVFAPVPKNERLS
ncbi:hypothetical protein APHAL10511_004008 [Amanita phalloides]|nr:hypothetical protein APHAL10511_004008 [Amanita phalloides]